VATRLTILYDEDCGFCTFLAQRLAKREGITDAAIGSALGDAALAPMSREERYTSFHVVDGTGHVSTAGEAVAVLLTALPGGRVTSRLAQRFPRLTDALYRRAAKHRDLLGRVFRVGACRVD